MVRLNALEDESRTKKIQDSHTTGRGHYNMLFSYPHCEIRDGVPGMMRRSQIKRFEPVPLPLVPADASAAKCIRRT